ncbi:MAG: S1 RNA-binding domain-containing protein [Patescibacteria group bacterium]
MVSATKTAPSGEMETLLNDENAPKLPKEGDVLTGAIIEIGSNITYVDLGPIGTGAIYGYGKGVLGSLSTFKDLKSGDPISATVTDLENEDGFVEMSLKETSMDMIWNELEKKMEEGEILTTKVLEANKGGLMIKVNGMVGFLPASQLTSDHYPRVSDGDKNKILSLLMQMVNTNVRVKIIGLDKEEGKLIVSEKATKEEEEKEKVSKLEVGNVVEGEISGIVDFGVFVKFNDSLEGLVHISELAWKLIDDPSKLFNVGQRVKCKIIGIDNARISLSIKALESDPWKNVHEKYKVGQRVMCEVTKINPFGIFAQLDGDIHGLAHISKLSESETKNIEVGKSYEFEIISIEPEDHRLGLKPVSSKKAEEKKEKPKAEEAKDEKEETESKQTD